MTPPKLIMPCPFFKLKFCANVPDALCPLSYFYILSLYVVSNLYEVQNFASPAFSLLLVSLFLAIYKLSTLFSK